MSNLHFTDTEIYQRAYLGKALDGLFRTVKVQMESVYRSRAILFPVSASSTLHFLSHNEGASLAEISKALKTTHQLSTQKIKILQKLSLVEKRADALDLRRFEWRLTRKGRTQARLLAACMDDVTHIYDEFYAELGVDLRTIVSDAQAALEQRTMSERFQTMFPMERSA